MGIRENNLMSGCARIAVAAVIVMVAAMPVVAADARLACDVAVIGGGSAGFAAAWSAATRGADVVLVEREDSLGGTSTVGGVCSWEPACGARGLPELVYERLKKTGHAGVYHFVHHCLWPENGGLPQFPGALLEIDNDAPYSATLRRHGPGMMDEKWFRANCRGVIFDPDAMARTMRAMIDETGRCRVMAGTSFVSAACDGGRITTLRLSDGTILAPKIVVDACGAVAKSVGCELLKSDRPNGASLIYCIARSADAAAAAPASSPPRCWWAENYPFACCMTLPNGEVAVNMLPTMSGEEVRMLGESAAYAEARRRVEAHWRWMQTKWAPFAGWKICRVAKRLAHRETFRVRGDYVLTGDDVRQGVRPPDEIASADHALDAHGGAGFGGELKAPYGIPYRCLIAAGMENLLLAGRIASFDSIAATSCRLSRTMMKLGEAAGAAAALAVQGGRSIRTVGADEIRAFDVRDFGAKGDGVVKDTTAVQKAIDAAYAAGGGRVVLSAGTYLSGTIWLKNGVDLHLEKGAVLKGSTDPRDYNANDAFPENFWSAGEEWSGGHLVFGYKVKDVAITGEGVIDGSGPAFFGECDEDSRFPWYKYGLKLHPTDRAWFRPGPMVAMFLSKNIRLSGVTLANTPCWTAHFRCCDGLDIRNVTIDADRTIANSDGFSIDCTRNVVVEGCTVKTGDDSFAIRASCRQSGHAEEHPCENIRIANCDVWSCCYGVRFGIGTGTVRNIVVENCRIHEAANGFGFNPAWLPGKKGVYIENIRISRCDVQECSMPAESNAISDDWRICDITFEDCHFESLLPSAFNGSASRHPENIAFRNCTRRHLDALRIRNHLGWRGERSRKFIGGGPVTNLRIENCLPSDERKGVLLLSFDDRNFDDWVKSLPIFEKYGAHATFFVSGPIDGEAVRVMKRISEAGHSVGLHGLRHANADEAISKMGADRYYTEEIEPQREACRVAYIPVKSFAYPNCRCTDETDALFRSRGFVHVRGGLKGVTPYDPKGGKQEGLRPVHKVDRAFFPASELKARFRLDTAIAGEAYHTDIEDILKCIRRCAERKEAFVLTSHGIHPDAKHIHMKTEWLERILATAKECGVSVLGFDELQ